MTVVVDDEVSQKDGKTYSKIIFVNRLGGTAPGKLVVNTPVEGAEMRELVAMSKAKAAAFAVLPADEGAPKAKAAADEDVPF